MSSAPTIVFDVRPSRLLLTMVAAVALLAMLATALSGLAWWLKVPLCVAVAGYAAQGMRQHLRQPVRRAGWQADGSWVLHLRGGREVRPALQAARLTGPMMFLHFSWDGGKAALAVLPDNVPAATRRRLRIRLSAWSDKR